MRIHPKKAGTLHSNEDRPSYASTILGRASGASHPGPCPRASGGSRPGSSAWQVHGLADVAGNEIPPDGLLERPVQNGVGVAHSGRGKTGIQLGAVRCLTLPLTESSSQRVRYSPSVNLPASNHPLCGSLRGVTVVTFVTLNCRLFLKHCYHRPIRSRDHSTGFGGRGRKHSTCGRALRTPLATLQPLRSRPP